MSERSGHCQIVEGEKRTERVAEDLEKLKEGQGEIQGNSRDACGGMLYDHALRLRCATIAFDEDVESNTIMSDRLERREVNTSVN